MVQVKIYDRENKLEHGGIVLEDGSILCGCCGGIIASDEISIKHCKEDSLRYLNEETLEIYKANYNKNNYISTDITEVYETMTEPKLCCNCLHCVRWRKKDGIECHCDLTDKYLGYLQVMDEENDCKHWEKETKWDLQRKHDLDLLDKVLEKIKDYSYEIDTELPPYTDRIVELRDIDSIIEEMKAEVTK